MTWHTGVEVIGSTFGWIGLLYVIFRPIVWSSALIKELFPLMHYVGWIFIAFTWLNRAAWRDTGWQQLLDLVFIIAYLYLWWIFRNDGDDRWKKRRRKMLAKVKQVGRKLVVVPIPQPLPIKN